MSVFKPLNVGVALLLSDIYFVNVDSLRLHSILFVLYPIDRTLNITFRVVVYKVRPRSNAVRYQKQQQQLQRKKKESARFHTS